MDLLERTFRAGLILWVAGAGTLACGSDDEDDGDATTTVIGATTTTGAAASTGQTSGSNAVSSTSGTTGAATTGAAAPGTTCDTTLSGEQFYMQPTECVLCHGADALGVPNWGPEARHPAADYTRWLIRNGRADHPDFQLGMPAYTANCLSDAMVEEILVFLNSFSQPTDGAGLYADYCANCHGSDGLGGVTARTLDGELHEIAGITGTGHDPTDYGNRREHMPVMTDRLSQQEIQLITDYLQNELGLAF